MSAADFLRQMLSLEDDVLDGKAKDEIEHAFYVKVNNFAMLEQAPQKLKIEQANFYTENKGKGSLAIRTRMTTFELHPEKQGKVEISLTIKPPNQGKDAGLLNTKSVDQETTPDLHSLFMAFGSPIFKHRFRIPIEGTELVWELDVFTLESGGFSYWIRVELEVPSKDYPLPELPFAVVDRFTASDRERRDALKAEGLVFQ